MNEPPKPRRMSLWKAPSDVVTRYLWLERENERLRGDIYLFGIGEITREKLIGIEEAKDRDQ